MTSVLSSIRQPERREGDLIGSTFKLHGSAIVLGPLVG